MSDRDAANPPAGGAGTNNLAQDPELVQEFILESQDHLGAIETHLLSIARGNSSSEALHAIFRGFHTIKGLAGFLEFGTIQHVAHEVETVLDQARNGQLAMTSNVVDTVLESADLLRQWLAAIHTGGEGPNPTGLLERVHVLGKAPEAPPAVEAAEPDLVEAAISPESTLPALANNMQPSALAAVEARSVKVDTSKLDHLVDMVGEMVIAQSMIQHDPDLKNMNRPRLARNLMQLARITDDVQKTAMAMRMMPVEHLFNRMRRVVHDIGRKTGKEIEMEITGGETELDRNLVEELGDPLMHMLRNAVDHGIEPADVRLAKGKPAAGRLRLSASHRSGHIVIEVADDGAGLDRTKILEKARRNGLISATEEPTDERVYELIFEPGFSTAATITDVSGRGVGMDVVRRQVQKLRGRIEIQSVPGQGSTFLLKLPLTLAIVDGLVVGVGAERYIIPLFAVREILRPEPGAVSTVQDKGELAVVRGRLLPLVRLYRRFGIQPRSEDPQETLLIVAEAANRVYCLMVDELIGKQEVVIKSLGPTLQNVPGVAGGAILGDGRVGLILDLDRVFDPYSGVQNSHAA
ncbi:MAG: chemotaxis protein CheA [Acidobacteria bacterium]|nr:chemotaxis protein CheA [Acidobacteriota bacterium]